MKYTLKSGIGTLLCAAAAAVTAITLSLPTPAAAGVESDDPIKSWRSTNGPASTSPRGSPGGC